jgi:hypothetical protein
LAKLSSEQSLDIIDIHYHRIKTMEHRRGRQIS